MKLAFTLLLVVHGLIHSMGFLKAFGLAQLPQLTLPISRPLGVLWLVAGAATLSAAVALHAYVEGRASMRVKVVSLVRMVNASGSGFTAAETVTLFNDMCVMAPATLIDPAIRWEPVDATHARAAFTAAGHTITATLNFDDEGRLVNFFSDDRPSLDGNGVTFTRQRWSTPLSDYRAFGPYRLASHGEARYHAPGNEYAYGEFTMESIEYNVHVRD